jgi:hypothetical protein
VTGSRPVYHVQGESRTASRARCRQPKIPGKFYDDTLDFDKSDDNDAEV